MVSLATAFVDIRPNTTGFGASLSRSVGTDADRAGRTAGSRFTGAMKGAMKLGTVLAGAAAVTGGISFFKGAIEEARDAQKVGAQTAAVLKSTGGAAGISAKGIGDLATAISNKTAVDDEAIQSGANLLLTFTNVRNEVGRGNDVFNQATATAVDMSAALGQDMRSSTIQLGKALNDPIKGITALSRVGVSFTQQQKDQIAAMVETGNTMGAQRLILGELNREFAGSAEAQATPAEQARVAWGNLQEQIGTQLLPVIDRLATTLTTQIIPAISQFVTEIQNGTGAGGQFRDVVERVASVLMSSASFLWDHKAAVAALVGVYVTARAAMFAFRVQQAASLLMLKAHTVGTIENSVATRVAAAASRVWAAGQWLLNAALAANPVGLVIVAIAALAAGIVVAYKRSDTFRSIVNGAFNAVRDAASFLWDRIRAFFGWLGDGFNRMGDLAGDFRRAINGAWDAVKTGTQRAVLFVVDKVLWLADKMLGAMARAFGWVPGIGPKLRKASDEVSAFKDRLNATMDKMNDEEVKVTIKGYASMAKNASQETGEFQRIGKAQGGPIPMVPGAVRGKDSVQALLMPDEHVLTAEEVKKAGGHGAILAMRKAIKAGVFAPQTGVVRSMGEGRPVPRFADGGPVFNVRTSLPPTGPITDARHALAVREAKAMQKQLKEAAARARAAARTPYAGAGTPNGNGGLGPAAIKAANFVRSYFNFGGTIGGYATSGHVTNSKHYVGKAIDIMQPVSPLATAMWNYFKGPGYSRFGVDNVIYNRQIYNAGRGVHGYFGTSPHTDHVHVDFFDRGGLARGRGVVPKRTIRPERVLAPRDTENFERLVNALDKPTSGGMSDRDRDAWAAAFYRAARDGIAQRNTSAYAMRRGG